MKVMVKLNHVTSVEVPKEVTLQCFEEGTRGKQGRRSQWNVHQEDGRKDGKCAGNGKEKGWKKRSVRGNYDVQEVDNYYSILFGIIINIKKTF